MSRKCEHKIKTRLACLRFVKKEYKKKYLGQILKDLIELKKLNRKVFKKTLHFIFEEFGEIRKTPFSKYTLFMFFFLLVQLPYLYNLPILKKAINKVLVYS
jgi:hypothetical protein